MKHRSTRTAHFVVTGVALAAASLWGTDADALGLGRLAVQSALGETMRAEIEVTSLTAEEAATLRVRVAPPEAYRAAGVDYNPVLPGTRVELQRRADGRPVLRVSSDRAVLEPFIDVIVEASWASGRLVREYTMLFDPPQLRAAQPPATPPQIAAAPLPAPAPVPSPAPPAPAVPAPVTPPAPVAAAPLPPPQPTPVPAPPPRPAPRPAEPPRAPAGVAPAPAPAPATPPAAAVRPPAGAETVTVRPGDSLGRIAGRVQPAGISLDQMLVALFRANPQAFMGENMNRLKSGSVLTVPSAEQAAATPGPQAREIVVAQSQDFDAYRQRLASGTPVRANEAPARQAAGRVQTQVEDRRQGATPPPDRLTLAQGASAPERQAATETQRRDANARLSELARNVEELRRLQGAAASAAAGLPVPPSVLAPPGAPAPSAATPPAAPALPGSTVVAAAPPSEPPQVATPPEAASAPAAAGSAVAAAPTSAPVPTPADAPPAAPAAEAPAMLDELLSHPWALPGAGLLVALLGGVGLWRVRSRLKKPSEETSFLESRLQPDSFFGASGGQRVDTSEAGASAGSTGASSMSYSLSQLDAIGDVDPVAEADVYLAYGRDLQAEEILKEAMRSDPQRMAIRTKLLEVYAKRRDTKGFELLATQVFNLSGGQGDDWAQAQMLGRNIDPDNPLYGSGGKPEEVIGVGGQPVEALSASTLPYTAPAPAPVFEPAPDATLSGGLDLDLDLANASPPPGTPGATGTATVGATAAAAGLAAAAAAATPAAEPPPGPGETTQAFATGAEPPTARSGSSDARQGSGDDSALDFDLGAFEPPKAPAPPAAPAAAPEIEGLDFDLGDLDAPAPPPARAPAPPPAAAPELDFGDFSSTLPPLNAEGEAEADALARKLELAEEFRQIGDLEGARDLLEEVLAKAEGVLRNKAQGMLDALG